MRAPGARILGLGAYRPRRRVTNDDLAQVMDTNDEWIQTRVGIAERRWASEDETLQEMAVAAGGKALAASGLSPDEVDLVDTLERLLPRDARYRHAHGSPGHGADHVLPALISPSVTVPVQDGEPLLGTWQSVVLVDLNRDNPRRSVRLSFLGA